jgi:uncharacterized protein
MIINSNNINEQKTEFDFTIEASEISLFEENVKLESSVKISGFVHKQNEKIQVLGKLITLLSINCDRCLAVIEKNFEIDIDAVFVDKNNESQLAEREIGDEDLNVSVLESDELDFAFVAREQILIELPTHFLCTDDCKGLCQKCRINKNIEDCSCNQKEIDPRWSALKNLTN